MVKSSPPPFDVQLSELDEQRFGIRTAKAVNVHAENVDALMAFCRAHAVKFCMARCPTQELNAVHALEDNGFRLMDTLVYYGKQLRKGIPSPTDSTFEIRPALREEEAALRELSRHCFKNYSGHYHADERLPKTACDDVYADWVGREISLLGPNREVLVAHHANDLAGFATLRLNSSEESEGVLFAVSPSAQGQGLYKSFMVHAMQWSAQKEVSRMIVSTQITNIFVQKVWAALGFAVLSASYTFHAWFS